MATQEFRAGDRVRVKAHPSFAGIYTVEEATHDGRLYLAGEVLGWDARQLELVERAPSAPPAAVAAPRTPAPQPDGFEALISAAGDNREAAAIVQNARAQGMSAGAAALALLESGALAETEEQHRAVYSGSPALQREFMSLESYLAFRRAETRGAVKVGARAVAQNNQSAVAGNDASLTAEFQSSPALQREFASLENYLALKRHEGPRH